MTYQNLCEKGTKPMKKELAQSGLPVLRKNLKITPKSTFAIFGKFETIFGTKIFSNLVSPIEL